MILNKYKWLNENLPGLILGTRIAIIAIKKKKILAFIPF
jgi:hypothetical protein